MHSEVGMCAIGETITPPAVPPQINNGFLFLVGRLMPMATNAPILLALVTRLILRF